MNFSDPQANIERIGIGEGSVVVDLGSGSGYYSLAAARAVGHEGRVYAVDVQKGLLERLKETAAAEHLSQIEIVWGDVEKIGGSKVGTETADLVLISNVLFQLENKEGIVTEALRVLRPNGRVCVIDWTDSHFGLGPDESLVVKIDDAKKLFADRFELDREFDAGNHHYGLVFRKK